MYNAYITEIKNVRCHPNADKLDLVDCFGNTVCVSHGEFAEGDLAVYFPTDGQLSEEFCQVHDLVRRKDDAGNQCGGYLEPGKRNIRAIRLRGERSDGLAMPLRCLEYTGIDIRTLEAGFAFTTINGKEICCKYIPRSNHRNQSCNAGNRTRKKTKNKKEYPYFIEHIDTPQLRFNLSKFQPGDYICLTEKVHGTSSRNGYALVQNKKTWFHKLFNISPTTKYEQVCGTRRTLVKTNIGGYYGSNAFRVEWNNRFQGKLLPGEQVFGEIAGFIDNELPIMPIVKNNKTKDKDFVLQYGENTVFSYGCEPTGKKKSYGRDDIGIFAIGQNCPINRYFIYRMTYTTPEGYVIEYPWDLVKIRAEQMGFEIVPELERFIYTTEEDFLNRITKYLDIPSTLDKRHIIEGIVVRKLNSIKFDVAKEKSWNFKIIEGIIKDTAETPDIEEQEELI